MKTRASWTREFLVGGFVVFGGGCMGVLGVEDLSYDVECDGEKPMCVGNAARTCGEDGLWKDSECVGQTCVGGACAGECGPGQPECVGNAVRECGADGFWKDSECVGQTCVGGACAGVCGPGETRCAGNSVESCGADGNFGSGVACVGQTCVSGACVGVCELGQQDCLGNTSRTCGADGFWNEIVCVDQTCDQGLCVGECAPDQRKCSGKPAGEMLCGPGGVWQEPTELCAYGCSDGYCVGPSCENVELNCGPSLDENCCARGFVPEGTYNRSNDPAYPATVSDFVLDRFEISVGRFRKFVEGYPGNKPAAGAGAHPLIANSGWDAGWDGNLPADKATLIANLKCSASFQTWTDAVGANENKPMNCINWYEIFAFCAWDGGRLPTEAEWNYAAAGGDEQREYPWSNPPSATVIDASYAVYDCLGDGSPAGQCAGGDILNIGSKSAKGDGKWGHADLGGSMWEWNLDWYASPYPSGLCNNCANILNGSARVLRGGGWLHDASLMLSSFLGGSIPSYRDDSFGGRCARTP